MVWVSCFCSFVYGRSTWSSLGHETVLPSLCLKEIFILHLSGQTEMQVAARVSVDGIQGMILASRALNPWDSDNGRDPSW